MDALRDALKGAIGGQEGLQAREPTPTLTTQEAEEDDPQDSPWIRELRRHEALPKDAKTERLRQLTDKVVKSLQAAGRRRDAETLGRLRDDWLRQQELRVWDRIKTRFAELELSEKAYRSLKQEKGVVPHKVLARLRTRRAEEFRGASAARVREWLLDLA